MLSRGLFRSSGLLSRGGLGGIGRLGAIQRFAGNAAVGKKGEAEIKPDLDSQEIPGFRAPGEIATNYEIATGKERYEHLKELKGEEPWEELTPIIMTHKGTKTNPIQVKGYDPVYYVGCSGYPADSHELIYLTLMPHKGVDRCPHCGQCFKYTQMAPPHSH